MNPSPHTILINAAIGFCIKNNSWIHPLADLGYKAQLIEQTIRAETSGKAVKPDVIATSKKTIHSIVFECKGGKTVDNKQISSYEDLTTFDLFRWVDVHTRDNFSHDVCIFNFKKNRELINGKINFPILSLSDVSIEKKNNFSKREVNRKFDKPISTKSMKPPISYYPFSELDDRRVVIPHVLRAMISVLMDRRINDIDVTDPEYLLNETVLLRIHKMWKILSKEHQNSLRKLVKEIIKDLKSAYPKFGNQIQAIQSGTKPNTQALSNLIKTCDEILKEEEEKKWLDDYFNI